MQYKNRQIPSHTKRQQDSQSVSQSGSQQDKQNEK